MIPIDVLKLRFASGSAAPQVNIFNATVNDTAADPADASAFYTLNSSGAGSRSSGAAFTWLLSGLNSDYQVRATLNSGSTPSGTLNSWVSLNTTRTWSLARTTVGTNTCQLFIEIRRIADNVVIDSATITMNATVSSTVQVNIFDDEIDVTQTSGVATASYALNSSGQGVGSGNWTWRLSGSSGDYEVRATEQVGTVTGGTVGAWLALSTSRLWNVQRGPAQGVKQCTLLIEIRRVSDGTVIDTANVTLRAEINPFP